MSARGVIAAGDLATAQAGADALRSGGNAIDAAVAAAFACFTAETMLATPGGAGILVGRHPERGTFAFDFFCRAPGLGGTRPKTMDFAAVDVDFGSATQQFHVGRAAAAPPTSMRGLLEVHAHLGKLPLAQLLAPAIQLAHEGVRLSEGVAFVLRLLEPIARRSEGSRALYTRNDQLLRAGDVHRNPNLGRVLEEVANTRTDPLTQGNLREALCREFGPASGGLITPDDLAAFVPTFRAPHAFRFHGRTVVTAPAPSTGGRLVAAALERLECLPERASFLSEGHVRAVATSLREMSRERARASQLGSTTHISVLDGAGGAAALTITSGECCGEVLSGTGIHLNNFLGEEDINPGGFHRYSPGAPMRTMTAPTIVLDSSGEPELALGSGGSNRLRSAIVQAIVNTVAFGAPLDEAIRAPRLHVEDEQLAYERVDLDTAVATALESDFATEAVRFDARNFYFGGVHAAARRGPRFEGAGDARRAGVAIVID